MRNKGFVKGWRLAVGVLGLSLLCACTAQQEQEVYESASINQLISQEAEVAEATIQDILDKGEQETDMNQELEQTQVLKQLKGLELKKSYKGYLDNNPIFSQTFGADPYAMVYEDRVYFYMTYDIVEKNSAGQATENTYSKIQSLRVVSTSDMINFTDHGEILVAGKKGAAKWASNSWAPAACHKTIDGKEQFFLYFANSGGGIGVLQSDSPTGPFIDPIGGPLISRQTPNCDTVLWLFDPAVLVDDDQRGYLYFGGGVPEGKVSAPGTGRVAALGEDMISIIGEPKTIDIPYLFEDSGIHKYGNKYYYTYCTNWQVEGDPDNIYGFRNAEIVSMESDSPMGPFVVKEMILENPGRYFGVYGNNHHCVFEFQNQWYITYHTRLLEKNMKLDKGYRSTHIDRFEMGEDGTIGVIKQTLNGREQLHYVNPYEWNPASNIALASEGIRMASVNPMETSGKMVLSVEESGSFVKVAGVDFGAKAPESICLGVQSKRVSGNPLDQVIQLRKDYLNGEIVGYLDLKDMEPSDEFVYLEAKLLKQLEGVCDLYFVFTGDNYQIEAYQFQ